MSIRLTCVEEDEQPSSQWNSFPDPHPVPWQLRSRTHNDPQEEIVILDSGTDSEPPEEEVSISAQMLRAEDSDDEKKEVIDLTPVMQSREPEVNYREQRFLQKLNKIEHRRRFKLQKRRLYYTRRDEIESSLTRWWRRRMIELQGYLEENRDELFREYDAIVQQFLTRYGMHQTLHGVAGLLSASAYEHYETLLQTVDGGGLANVLVTRDKQARNETYNSHRWCVDSGANRHLCRDRSLAKGKETEKKLVIGEAGIGHSLVCFACLVIEIPSEGFSSIS